MTFAAITRVFQLDIREDLAQQFESGTLDRSAWANVTYEGTIPGKPCFPLFGKEEKAETNLCFQQANTKITAKVQATYDLSQAGKPTAVHIGQIELEFGGRGFGKDHFYMCDLLSTADLSIRPFPIPATLKEGWCRKMAAQGETDGARPLCTPPPESKTPIAQVILDDFFYRPDPCEAPDRFTCVAMHYLQVKQLMILPGDAQTPHVLAKWKYKARWDEALIGCGYSDAARESEGKWKSWPISGYIFPSDLVEAHALPPTKAAASGLYQALVKAEPHESAYHFFGIAMALFLGEDLREAKANGG